MQQHAWVHSTLSVLLNFHYHQKTITSGLDKYQSSTHYDGNENMLLLATYRNFSKNMYSSFQDTVDNTGNIFINFLKTDLLYDPFQYICIFMGSMLWYIKALTINLLEMHFNLLTLLPCFALHATHYIPTLLYSLSCFLCTMCTKWTHKGLTTSVCLSTVCIIQLENY
jgi:hypothetical protein